MELLSLITPLLLFLSIPLSLILKHYCSWNCKTWKTEKAFNLKLSEPKFDCFKSCFIICPPLVEIRFLVICKNLERGRGGRAGPLGSDPDSISNNLAIPDPWPVLWNWRNIKFANEKTMWWNVLVEYNAIVSTKWFPGQSGHRSDFSMKLIHSLYSDLNSY